MLKLVNVSRRMAIIETTGGGQIYLTRARGDGSTIGFRATGIVHWKSIDTQELLDGLAWVTMTDDQLLAAGMPKEKVKRKPKQQKEAIPF